MSTKFQTLCRKPRSIRLSSFENMSDYVTEMSNLNNSIESYDSTLQCRSFWDTLYVIFLFIDTYFKDH